jgi:fructose-1,6-bisphosphatase/inositol monophosphatase family enzyme
MRSWGDAYGYVLVATGRADAMLDPLINPWDLTPMLPIVAEAGGTVTDWAGQTPRLDKERWPNALATNGKLLTPILEILRG